MIGICLGVRVVKWLIGIFANATVRTLRSLRSLRVLMAAAASSVFLRRERLVERSRRMCRVSMGGAEHPAALQGVPSHRDATRKGVEQFAQKPHSIRHTRMFPII